jgi:NTP pyrophosphatase (non-canonical NTP hydrolase)
MKVKLYLLVPSAGVDEKPTLCLSGNLASDIAEGTGCSVVPVEFDLRVLVKEYFEFRRYVDPNAAQAFFFLSSEVGELADKYVHSQAQWVRNNPQNKNDDVAGEIGDVLQMLTKFAEKVGVDPLEAMLAKWERKGFVSGKD